MIGLIGFNLYFNTACSFLAGIVIVFFSVKLLRIKPSRWKLFLLLIPFGKMLWDLFYLRIPTGSIVNIGVDPLSLPPKSQTLTIGAGVSWFGPMLNIVFRTNDAAGVSYSTSVADYLYYLIVRNLGPHFVFWVLGGCLAVSLFLLLRRIFWSLSFEKTRKIYRKSDKTYQEVKLGRRKVDIYFSPHFMGSPFTGGFLNPYVCIPSKAQANLSSNELAAVIKHELGHIRNWDLVGTMAVQYLGDLFWFVPFYRTLSKKIDHLRELLADDDAVRMGAIPEDLASALLRLQNTVVLKSGQHYYSAFFREKKFVKTRIQNLLNQRHPFRPDHWLKLLGRAILTFWIAGAVMVSTFGGNHEVSVREVASWVDTLPFGLGLLLKKWGVF